MTFKLHNLLLFIPIVGSGIANAQVADKVAYSDQQYIGNVSDGSHNPVAESYMPITDVADMHIDYLRNSGDFHRADAPGSSQSWLVSFTGMKKVGKVVFAGGLTYDNTVQNDRRWNNTIFVSRYNPYVIGDSIFSKFNRETFKLDGAAIYIPTERLRLGLRARYDVGSSATQKDPRPEIKGMRFTLNPGVDYSLGNHSIGLSANVGWLSESSTTTVEKTTTKQYVFLFQGLGVYETKDAIGYRRRYEGFDYGASLQFVFNRDKDARVSDFIEVGYTNSYEDAVDGSNASRYKGGKYMGNGVSVKNRLRLRYGDNAYHNIALSGLMHDTKGRWYNQKVTTDQSGNLTYEVINESDYYEGKNICLSASYRYDLLDGSIPKLSASIDATYDKNEIKNKLYGASENYSMVDLVAQVTRRFAIRKSCLGISIKGLYGFSPDGSLNVSSMPSTYSLVVEKFTRPDYDYLTSGYFGGGASATYSLPLNFSEYNSLLNISLQADYRRATASATSACHDTDRYMIYGTIGFVF
ncbi:MAG: hypothetical protein NC343_03045 [Muribaculum sp.]|nr:hypothetical protein [Muribaculaceae bacterium]MCM1080704.1 hypothetical protein [Muribaculum sp.]